MFKLEDYLNPLRPLNIKCCYCIFMSPGVVDTGAHLGVGNMWVCGSGLAKFVQAVSTKPLPHIIRHFDYLT